MASDETAIVRIEGDPFLSRAKAYLNELQVARKAWSEFAKRVGAKSMSDPLGSLFFDEPPAGWVKADTDGRSRPKRGSALETEMMALPKQPSTWPIFGDAIISEICYEGPDGKGSDGSIGFMFWGPKVGPAGDVLLGVIPHAGRAAIAYLARHPGRTIVNGADKWTMPDGLVEISEAEAQLLIAQAKVDKERQKTAA